MTRNPTSSLEAAYDLKGPDDNLRLYANWAPSYDSDFVARLGYRLAEHVARRFNELGGMGPALDVGAGTGLVGQHLARLGVAPVDGTDLSPEMLETARTKGVYRCLFAGNVTARLDVPDESYAGILSAGTFTLGHVGPDGFDELMRIAQPGAHFTISVNTTHFTKAGFAAKLEELAPRITDVTKPETRIYDKGSPGSHANDTALLLGFVKR